MKLRKYGRKGHLITLLAVWVRKLGRIEELIVASDSRLTGGMIWDGCPKIMTLPRSDCVIAFAGDTAQAYPLMLQLYNSVGAYDASRTRRLDLVQAKTHSIAVVNELRQNIRDLPYGQGEVDDPNTLFVLAGHSWRRGSFVAWRLRYAKNLKRFTFAPITGIKGFGKNRLVKFLGDRSFLATSRLAQLLKERGRLQSDSLDMEPLEILISMIQDNGLRSIGGAPQVVKVYKHLNVQSFAIRWPDASGSPHYFGRPLLAFENVDVPVLDPWNGYRIDYGHPSRAIGDAQATPEAEEVDDL